MWNAATGHVEVITRLLRSLSTIDKTATLVVGKEGVKIMVWDASHVLCGQLFLDTDLFATYKFDCDEVLTVQLSLQAFVWCLQMFVDWRLPTNEDMKSNGYMTGPTYNTTANCFFNYVQRAGTFDLRYAHETMTSNCKINLIENDGINSSSGIVFDADEVLLQVIMPASILASTLRDLESVQTEQLGIRAVTKPTTQLELQSTSVLATSTFVLPNDPKVMEAFWVEGGDSQFVYEFSHFSKTREALKHAKRASLRYDSYGVLSLQCMYEVDAEKKAYLEFRILPLETDAVDAAASAPQDSVSRSNEMQTESEQVNYGDEDYGAEGNELRARLAQTLTGDDDGSTPLFIN